MNKKILYLQKMIKQLIKKAQDNHIDTYILLVGLLFMLGAKTWCLANLIHNKLMSDQSFPV